MTDASDGLRHAFRPARIGDKPRRLSPGGFQILRVLPKPQPGTAYSAAMRE